MKVYIVRHGQSEGNRLEKNCGWSSTPLSELGHAQAKAANAYLKDEKFDKIFCSSLPRAMQTCEDALPGSQPIYTDKIREISVGTLADKYIADNAAEYGDEYWESVKQQDFRQYGGESKQQMQARVIDFIHEIEALDGQCDKVAVFGHEGTVHQWFNYTVGYEVLLEHMQIQNASVSVFEYKDGNWSLVRFSYVGEL